MLYVEIDEIIQKRNQRLKELSEQADKLKTQVFAASSFFPFSSLSCPINLSN